MISPELTVEPLPTMYLRRAQSYAFVRQVLHDAFGKEALAQMQRLTSDDPVKKPLDAELNEMEALFYGAHVVSSRQLGRLEHEPGQNCAPRVPSDDAQRFLKWATQTAADPDLGRDVRMMVPVFTDGSQRIKVWCVLGWKPQHAWVKFTNKPAVSVVASDGTPAEVEKKFEVSYATQGLSLATPVFAEVWVKKLLNRDEFRKHCDTYVTPTVILANLE